MTDLQVCDWVYVWMCRWGCRVKMGKPSSDWGSSGSRWLHQSTHPNSSSLLCGYWLGFSPKQESGNRTWLLVYLARSTLLHVAFNKIAFFFIQEIGGNLTHWFGFQDLNHGRTQSKECGSERVPSGAFLSSCSLERLFGLTTWKISANESALADTERKYLSHWIVFTSLLYVHMPNIGPMSDVSQSGCSGMGPLHTEVSFIPVGRLWYYTLLMVELTMVSWIWSNN